MWLPSPPEWRQCEVAQRARAGRYDGFWRSQVWSEDRVGWGLGLVGSLSDMMSSTGRRVLVEYGSTHRLACYSAAFVLSAPRGTALGALSMGGETRGIKRNGCGWCAILQPAHEPVPVPIPVLAVVDSGSCLLERSREPGLEVGNLLVARRVAHARVRLEAQTGARKGRSCREAGEAELLEQLDRLDAVCGLCVSGLCATGW